MRRKRHISTGWVYLGIFISLILICIPPAREYWQLSSTDERIAVSHLPQAHPAQLLQRMEKINTILAAPAQSDPMVYYRMLGKTYRFEREIGEYERELTKADEQTYRLRSFSVILQNKIMRMQQRYQERHSRDTMYQLAENNRSQINKWTSHESKFAGKTYVSYASFWQELGKAYLYSVALAAIFFCFRLRDKRCRVLLESWRLLPIATMWPGTVFFYPHRVDPRNQLRQMLAFCMYLLTIVFSFGSASIAKAAEQMKGGNGSSGKKTIQVIDDNDTALHLSITNATWSKYVVGTGKVPHDGPVDQTTITATHRSGAFFEFAGSTGLDGKENGGRELDWTLGWTGKNVGAGLAYFDLSPLLSDRKGDVVNAYIETFFTKELPYNLTFKPAAKLELMVVTTDIHDLSDWVGTGGFAISWKPHNRVSIDQCFRAIYDGGVFGGDHGLLGRYDASVDVRATDHISFALFQFKHFVPLVGLHDRQPVSVFGAGITFQY